MKRKKVVGILVGLLFVLTIATTANAVLVQEVYPDPVGTDTGGEAILLYNEGDVDVDISGWTVSTPSSATDATLPANSSLAPRGLYLVSDTGWSLNKDNTSWADADYENALTLRNTGGVVSLNDAAGTTIDSVTYPDSEEGIAYWRVGAELVATEPIFDAPLDALYLMNIDSNVTTAQGSIMLTDNGTPVTKMRPVPGKTKFLTVTVESEAAPTLEFNGVSQVMEQLGVNEYTAEIAIPYSLAPGEHIITADEQSYSFEVLPLLAIDSDVATLELGNSSGAITIAGDAEFGSGGLTIRNIGNVDVEVSLSRTSLLHESGRKNGKVTATIDGSDVRITSKKATLTTLQPEDAKALSLRIELPNTAPSGGYRTSFAFQLKRQT